MKIKNKTRNNIKDYIILLPFLLLFIILLPFFLVFSLYYKIRGLFIGYLVLLKWYPLKKYILFVYFTKKWKKYVRDITNTISTNAIILDWNERKRWDLNSKKIELKVLNHYIGIASLNKPSLRNLEWKIKKDTALAIIFVPWWRPTVMRFNDAFKELDKGNKILMRKAKTELLSLVADLKNN